MGELPTWLNAAVVIAVLTSLARIAHRVGQIETKVDIVMQHFLRVIQRHEEKD